MAIKLNVRMNNITYNCGIGLILRILLSIYSLFHDKYFKVQYTDIDYKIFTNAAKEVVAQRSPYEQQTFRYSPIFAYILTPNVFLHPIAGKLISSFFDVCLAYFIFRIVNLIYNNQKKALQCAQLWIYNPLPLVISTRGNIDSFSSVIVLVTLFYHLKQNYILSGIILGFCVHLRLYPVIFVLPMLVTANRFSYDDTLKSTIKSKLQLLAAFSLSLASLTGAFYYIYGFKFIEQSILYHLFRQDTRHNFSLYFYLQYLDAYVPDLVTKTMPLFNPKITKQLLIIVPQIVLLISVTFKYNTLNHLPFNMFCSAFIFVVFNKVLTSQYFIWFLSLLPLFLPSVVISTKKVFGMIFAWIAAQSVWLLFAYLLEYEGYDVFTYIHVCGILFFLVNVWILDVFLNNYNSQYFKKFD